MRNSASLSHRTKEAVSMYRTSNQTYGSRAPTVHEMPVSASQACQDEGHLEKQTYEESELGDRKSVV